MMNKAPIYTGITGFNTCDQVENAINVYESLGCNEELMTGFLFGWKQFHNREFTNPRFVSREELPELLECAKGTMRTVHYNTHNKQFSREIIPVLDEFDVEAVQLNIVRPNKEEIRKIKNAHPDVKIIFQANRSILNNVDGYFQNDKTLPVEYCLVDPSGGRGKEFDRESFDQWINDLSKNLPNTTFGIAGGLSPENVGKYIEEFPNFSIDTETKVRTNNQLDDEKVEKFLKNACRL
jgi:phosphoribosylanthranilate isomerase